MLRTLVLVSLAALVALPALADPPTARTRAREKGDDAKELRRDKRKLRDDKRDAARFADLLRDFEAARKAGNTARLERLDHRVAAALDRALREARGEAGADEKKTRQSRRDVRRDRKAAKGAARDKRAGATRARGEALADARADRHDARTDAAQSQVAKTEVRRVRDAWGALMGKKDRKSVGEKHQLLTRMVRAERGEVRRSKKEVRDGKREVREERRKSRRIRRKKR